MSGRGLRRAAHRLTVKDVPVDDFWSISVYNSGGRFVKNEDNADTRNNITAKKNDDQVRLYRPRKEILDCTWKFRQRLRASDPSTARPARSPQRAEVRHAAFLNGTPAGAPGVTSLPGSASNPQSA
jgi:hypothetical protein